MQEDGDVQPRERIERCVGQQHGERFVRSQFLERLSRRRQRHGCQWRHGLDLHPGNALILVLGVVTRFENGVGDLHEPLRRLNESRHLAGVVRRRERRPPAGRNGDLREADAVLSVGTASGRQRRPLPHGRVQDDANALVVVQLASTSRVGSGVKQDAENRGVPRDLLPDQMGAHVEVVRRGRRQVQVQESGRGGGDVPGVVRQGKRVEGVRDDVPRRHGLLRRERSVGGPHRDRLRRLEDREAIDAEDGGRRSESRLRTVLSRLLPRGEVGHGGVVLAGGVLQEEPAVLILEVHLDCSGETCGTST